MTVTVYRYDDPGAPLLGYNLGTLIDVLDACLVNGYTGKPAAGWAKVFSGAGKAVYQQGAGSTGKYLRVDHIVNREYGYTRAYESMTDIDTGTNPFPLPAQMTNGVYCYVSNNTATTQFKSWVLLADSKRFYLCSGGVASTAALSTSNTTQNLFFFGDITSYRPGDVFHCVISGGYSSSVTTDQSGSAGLSLSTTVNGLYISRSSDQVSLSTPIARLSMSSTFQQTTNMGALSSSSVYPDPVSGGLRLGRVYASNGITVKALRGHFPGLWAPMNGLPGANGDTFSGSDDLVGRDFILLDSTCSGVRGRLALETSDTWD